MRSLSCLALLAMASCTYLRDRGLDFADCFKVNAGAGIGLAVDIKLTDYVSPGVGVASYTINAGWDDRRIYGVWRESDVINTPRIAYEVFLAEQGSRTDENVEAATLFTDLALSSLNLPNERWLRDGDSVTVEYYSLFNFWGAGERHRARAMTGHIVDPTGRARMVDKSVWQKGFFDLGIAVGPVAARAGFNPLQFVDFLGGLFGLDLADDDGKGRKAVRLRDREIIGS